MRVKKYSIAWEADTGQAFMARLHHFNVVKIIFIRTVWEFDHRYTGMVWHDERPVVIWLN